LGAAARNAAPDLRRFQIFPPVDRAVVPVLQEILSINPAISHRGAVVGPPDVDEEQRSSVAGSLIKPDRY